MMCQLGFITIFKLVIKNEQYLRITKEIHQVRIDLKYVFGFTELQGKKHMD